MTTKLCERCKRRIKSDAVSCVCGWSAGSFTRPARIACCFVGCIEDAVCRVQTETGIANVCLTCYPKVDIKRRRSDSPAAKDSREAYERSHDYAMRNGIKRAAQMPTNVDAELALMKERMRQPGEDDELVRWADELIDRAQA